MFLLFCTRNLDSSCIRGPGFRGLGCVGGLFTPFSLSYPLSPFSRNAVVLERKTVKENARGCPLTPPRYRRRDSSLIDSVYQIASTGNGFVHHIHFRDGERAIGVRAPVCDPTMQGKRLSLALARRLASSSQGSSPKLQGVSQRYIDPTGAGTLHLDDWRTRVLPVEANFQRRNGPVVLKAAKRATPTGAGIWSSGLLNAIPASGFLGGISMMLCSAHQNLRWRSKACGQILIRPILDIMEIDYFFPERFSLSADLPSY